MIKFLPTRELRSLSAAACFQKEDINKHISIGSYTRLGPGHSLVDSGLPLDAATVLYPGYSGPAEGERYFSIRSTSPLDWD